MQMTFIRQCFVLMLVALVLGCDNSSVSTEANSDAGEKHLPVYSSEDRDEFKSFWDSASGQQRRSRLSELLGIPWDQHNAIRVSGEDSMIFGMDRGEIESFLGAGEGSADSFLAYKVGYPDKNAMDSAVDLLAPGFSKGEYVLIIYLDNSEQITSVSISN